MWPFRKKIVPPPTRDFRVWNDDWKVGDTAECVVGKPGCRQAWDDCIPPWHRPAPGQQLTVSGFNDGFGGAGAGRNDRFYFLHFSDWPIGLPTQGFRKVRPVATEQSEVVERILTAKPGTDKVRKAPATTDLKIKQSGRADDSAGAGHVSDMVPALLGRPFHDSEVGQ